MPTLIDVYDNVNDPEAAGIISTVVEEFPAMSMFDVEFHPNMKVADMRKGLGSRPKYRDFREPFTSSESAPVEPLITALRIFGDRIEMDPEEEEIMTKEGRNYRAERVSEVSDNIAMDFKLHLLGKSKTIKSPDGIYQWIDYWNTRSSAELLIPFETTTAGATILSKGSAHLIKRLRKLISEVQPTMLLVNKRVTEEIEALTQSADSAALAAYFTWGYVPIGMNGEQVYVARFAGVPMFDMGDDSQDLPIQPFDEVVGGDTDCTSIVAVRTSPRARRGFKIALKNSQQPRIREFMDNGMMNIDISMPNATVARGRNVVGRLYGIKEPA